MQEKQPVKTGFTANSKFTTTYRSIAGMSPKMVTILLDNLQKKFGKKFTLSDDCIILLHNDPLKGFFYYSTRDYINAFCDAAYHFIDE